MNKKLHYYHIIVANSEDIEKNIKHLNPWPILHKRGNNEKICSHCAGDFIQSEGTYVDGEWRLDEDQGRRAEKYIAATGWESRHDGNEICFRVPGESCSETPEAGTGLCIGGEGTIIANEENQYTVKFPNGGERKYFGDCGTWGSFKYHMGRIHRDPTGGSYYNSQKGGRLQAIPRSPFKLACFHRGTRRSHWHFIYISSNRHWGHNSTLGRVIRGNIYKLRGIECLTCLCQYLYRGHGRQILVDLLTASDIEACQCAAHSLGVKGPGEEWETKEDEVDCVSWGNNVFLGEGTAPEEGHVELLDTGDEADGYNDREGGGEGNGEIHVPSRKRKIDARLETDRSEGLDPGNWRTDNGRSAAIVLLLCDNGAFTESQATRLLARSVNSIGFLCNKQFNERIKYWTGISRILVFQEKVGTRFDRAKTKYAKEYPEDLSVEKIDETIKLVVKMLTSNNIDVAKFITVTYKHFIQESGKKNNLFFIGPPSTGKTMLMNSLVDCHFNYSRLTGLVSNSSFNFSGLLHTNACLMDECKLTDNQFEQWKLLASGAPMSTDVKYKDRNDVENCVLYTCSNFAIETYCNVPCAQQAVAERTHQFNLYNKCTEYFRIAPQVWEQLWREYAQMEIIGS